MVPRTSVNASRLRRVVADAMVGLGVRVKSRARVRRRRVERQGKVARRDGEEGMLGIMLSSGC
jgi:hypothetical protein